MAPPNDRARGDGPSSLARTGTVLAPSTIISRYVVESDDENSGDRCSNPVLMVRHLLGPKSGDPFRLRLLSDASDAAEALAGLQSSKSEYLRAVTMRLRETRYNAGVCKTNFGRETPGWSYEYIDVVVSGNDGRYVVDLDFASEFLVARATEEYARLVATLPTVMVGRPEEVRKVVQVVAQEAGRSLVTQGLSVAPWRTPWSMVTKWLGPYRRTDGTAGDSVVTASEVKCRIVGFRIPGKDLNEESEPQPRDHLPWTQHTVGHYSRSDGGCE